MGKSSSSLKKKRPKKSSKVRSKKISKSSARKSKSKKLRPKDSISDSSDDDSRSSFSVSSYSSEDETRSRRARSRTRKDVKSGKKRARKRSSSRDSSEDSHRVKKKKKKGAKKSSGSRGRKRTHEKKKKARRDASVSSISSGSRCASGCRYGHGSSGESEYESKKESNETIVDKIQTERYRSIDHPALYDKCTESIDHWIQEKDMGENNNNPRRLRSVIIVIKQEDEGRESDNKEQPKEEIICDHDDYPSSRSNDSNDGGNKEESDNNTNTSFDSKKKIKAEVEKEGAVVSNNPCNEARDATGDPGEEDLETVLRLRALENLKKFRGKGLRDNKTGKETISVEVEPFQNKPVEENDARGVKTTELVEKRDLARSLRIDEKRLYQNDDCNQSGSPRRVAVADNLQKKVSPADDSVMDKPKLGASALKRQNSTKPQTTSKQASASQKTCETPVSSKDKISAVDGQAMARTITEGSEGVNPNAHGSTTTTMEPPSLKSPAEATISKEPQDEAKETSQYEQKTMSVMRGGEMVQVSYKVYIPKKTPALARRQLKR